LWVGAPIDGSRGPKESGVSAAIDDEVSAGASPAPSPPTENDDRAGPATVSLTYRRREVAMPQVVDFEKVSTAGLDSSPFAEALAGLRANEARYYRNKYGHVFAVNPASEATETVNWVKRILEAERDIVIAARPLEATSFEVDGMRMAYVFYESGLSINVMYGVEDGMKRAVGFKLSEGMEVPEELASRFKFARQKSKLAGTIRGSLLSDTFPLS